MLLILRDAICLPVCCYALPQLASVEMFMTLAGRECVILHPLGIAHLCCPLDSGIGSSSLLYFTYTLYDFYTALYTSVLF
jgi:hypothetical protein